MKKRSKSISLSDEVLKELSKMLKEERRHLLSNTPKTNNSEMPSFSSFVEKLLWEALKNRKKS